MDFKGTKGKWTISGMYILSGGVTICETCRIGEENKANARLISQAPDLLKSLQKLVEMMKSPCVLSEEGFLKELDASVKEAEEVIKKSLNIE